ncbi:MAG: hypothetical protein GWP14_08485 [Actinobacteria bacterium]|nr:hypothetical protein [Actinomycetota bacterium]
MPQFQIEGYGRNSGRRRKRTYRARTEQEAILKASEDGTIVETTKQLPEEPASDRQIAYARGVGLTFPPDITMHEMSDLLTRYEHERDYGEKDEVAPIRLRQWVADLGISTTKYVGKIALFSQVMANLNEPGKEEQLALWFTYLVVRECQRASWYHPVDSGVDHDIVHSIAEELAENNQAMRSVKRYEGWQLINFGQKADSNRWLHGGGSKRTIAYNTTRRLIKERLGIQAKRGRANRPGARFGDFQVHEHRKGNKVAGHNAIVAIIVLIVLLVIVLRSC